MIVTDRMRSWFTRTSPDLAKRIAREEMYLISELRHSREDAGLSMEDVARKLGISIGDVCRLENLGYNPTLSELRYYMLAIGVYCEFNIKSGKNL